MNPPQTLETKRLWLRQPVTEDSVLIFKQYAQDLEVTKYISWQPHKSIRETDEYIGRCISVWVNNTAFPYVLIRKEDAQLIGMIGNSHQPIQSRFGVCSCKVRMG
jgi:RimJ/RimL family protein N-acetyltransferase